MTTDCITDMNKSAIRTRNELVTYTDLMRELFNDIPTETKLLSIEPDVIYDSWSKEQIRTLEHFVFDFLRRSEWPASQIFVLENPIFKNPRMAYDLQSFPWNSLHSVFDHSESLHMIGALDGLPFFEWLLFIECKGLFLPIHCTAHSSIKNGDIRRIDARFCSPFRQDQRLHSSREYEGFYPNDHASYAYSRMLDRMRYIANDKRIALFSSMHEYIDKCQNYRYRPINHLTYLT